MEKFYSPVRLTGGFIISVYKEMYDQLQEIELVKNDVSIIEIDDVEVEAKQRLVEANISFDEIITFQRQDFINKNGGSEITPAVTSFYLTNNQPKAVVFIKRVFFPEELEGNDLYKYLFLIHELAHVQDFRNCKYINWKTKESNLLKAEIYAEVSTLRFLCQQGDDLHKVCRSIYASRLVDFQTSENALNREILKGVVKKYPLKKLNQWARSLG